MAEELSCPLRVGDATALTSLHAGVVATSSGRVRRWRLVTHFRSRSGSACRSPNGPPFLGRRTGHSLLLGPLALTVTRAEVTQVQGRRARSTRGKPGVIAVGPNPRDPVFDDSEQVSHTAHLVPLIGAQGGHLLDQYVAAGRYGVDGLG